MCLLQDKVKIRRSTHQEGLTVNPRGILGLYVPFLPLGYLVRFVGPFCYGPCMSATRIGQER